MIKVRMLTHIVGAPTPSYHTGDIVELEDRIAKAWIADGLAALDRDEKPIERAAKS